MTVTYLRFLRHPWGFYSSPLAFPPDFKQSKRKNRQVGGDGCVVPRISFSHDESLVATEGDWRKAWGLLENSNLPSDEGTGEPIGSEDTAAFSHDANG